MSISARTPTPRARLAVALLVGLPCAFAVGRMSAPAPRPAANPAARAPLDLTQPVVVSRLDPPNAELLDLVPYAAADGRSTEALRTAPPPAARWSVQFSLEDGRRLYLSCEQVRREPAAGAAK